MQTSVPAAPLPAALDPVTPDPGPPPLAPPPLAPPARKPPGVWKFWGTTLWGVFVFLAMFLGQLTVVGVLLFQQHGPLHLGNADGIRDALESLKLELGGGNTISWSVIMGLPAVALALWLAIRLARMSFADYLALRGASWKYFLGGTIALIVLVAGWDQVSRLADRDASPGFMLDVLKSAQADNGLWLLVIAFCIAAPMTEEFFARGFLYRGWSESFLRPAGAIVLSSLVWTAMHLQYDWFFLCEVFSIGLLLGYMRYLSKSLWLTIFLHGLNNLAATVQTIWLLFHPQG